MVLQVLKRGNYSQQVHKQLPPGNVLPRTFTKEERNPSESVMSAIGRLDLVWGVKRGGPFFRMIAPG